MPVSSGRLRQIVVWLLVGITVYAVAIVLAGWDDIRISLAGVGWQGWAAVVGLSTLNIGVRFVRWQYYLRRLGHPVPAAPSLGIFVAGFAFTSTPAKAGEAVRSLYLHQYGVSYTNSFAALFVERLTDLIAVVLLAVSAALAFETLRLPVLMATLVTLALLPLVHSLWLRQWLDGVRKRLSWQRARHALGHLLNMLESSASLLRSGPLYFGMFLSLIAATLISTAMYVSLSILGVEVSPFVALGIYAAGILVGALSFLPGGIGGAEAVMGIGLVLLGLEKPVIATAIIMCRVAGMWYPIALGMPVLLGMEWSRR